MTYEEYEHPILWGCAQGIFWQRHGRPKDGNVQSRGIERHAGKGHKRSRLVDRGPGVVQQLTLRFS